MDAFGFRFVWITSEGKSLRPANARGKHLRNRGPGSRRGDQLKPNSLFADREQPRAALSVDRGSVGGSRAGGEHAATAVMSNDHDVLYLQHVDRELQH